MPREKKAKLEGKGEHELEVASHDPIKAYCSCGGWRYKADLSFESSGAAYLYVDRWFQFHKKLMKRAA
jgi:hypothetical protein